jgi:hypothetical protein
MRGFVSWGRFGRAGNHWLAAFLSFFTLYALGQVPAHAADSQNPAASTMLVELFTSEGCSSCPPADAWLEKIDSAQPVPGVQLIVLSEHVDYWDHDGWKDPYSSAQFTERQSGYMQSLGLKEPYTPQVIVNGTAELKLQDQHQVGETIRTAAAESRMPVRIDNVRIDPAAPGILAGHVRVDGSAAARGGDLYVATALDHATSQVLRGENGGRRLTHVAVVEELKRIGKVEKGKTVDQDFQVKLKPGSDSANLRVVAFVQQPNEGKVLGAALHNGSDRAK